MATYRAGIVGCGGMGRGHARGYLQAGCEVVAGVEPNRENAQKFGETCDAHIYTDYREMLEKESLDFVSVCTWPTTHCEITVAAADVAQQGILCEKPLAVTLLEADQMLAACKKRGVVLATGHQHRFDPQAVIAKQWIDEGRIGDRVMFWGHCGLDLMNNGTHVLDLIHFFNGDAPAEWVMGQIDCRNLINGQANHPDMVAEDASVGHIKYANGLRATVEMGTFAPRAYQFHLYGTEGMIDVNVPGGPPVRILTDVGWEVPEVDTKMDGTANKVVQFVKSVEVGERPESHGEIGRQILEVMIGVFESSRRRALIEFPIEVDDNPLRSMMEQKQV
jgi:predicted dehydrogenase